MATAKARLSKLAKTIELDVIPRLARAHRVSPVGAIDAAQAVHVPTGKEVEAFAALTIDGSEASIGSVIGGMRRRGMSVEMLYLDLFAPAARHLGELWDEDLCDFSTVTVALGRLQRLLRELSPTFGTEVEHPPNGRRALLAQPPQEQHSFGLSMVAEFFRRDGWEIFGGVGGAVTDPALRVQAEWFDLVGFSIGSETRLDWLQSTIAAVRAASRNRSIVILVGGPIFTLHPQWAVRVGADATSPDGRAAPQIAENLLAGSVRRG